MSVKNSAYCFRSWNFNVSSFYTFYRIGFSSSNLIDTIGKDRGLKKQEYSADLLIYNNRISKVMPIEVKRKGSFAIIRIIQKWFAKNGQNLADSSSNKKKLQRETLRRNPVKNSYYYIILGIATFLLVISFNFIVQSNKWIVREVPNVHYMDSVGSNLLFRGGLPLTGRSQTFNYSGLKQAIINAGKQAGVKVPSSFYILDVNFLNIENPADAQRIAVEQRFFQCRPKLGRIRVWGMNGAGFSVNDPFLIANRMYMARNLDNWLNDRLAGRVEILRSWLENSALAYGEAKSSSSIPGKNPLPVVVYIHCVDGCDRTGEFSGAYYLRYLHKSWEEVNAINRSMCNRNRPFGCKNYRALQWYCLWLNMERGFSLNWWKEFSCSGK